MAHKHITQKEDALKCTHCKTTMNLFHPVKPGPVQAFMQHHAACTPVKRGEGSTASWVFDHITRSTKWNPSSN